jgi:hypothetical protein
VFAKIGRDPGHNADGPQTGKASNAEFEYFHATTSSCDWGIRGTSNNQRPSGRQGTTVTGNHGKAMIASPNHLPPYYGAAFALAGDWR